MRFPPLLQFVIDGCVGLLGGTILGLFCGMALGLVCGLIFFCLPFLAVVGIMVVLYSLCIGLCSGAVTGLLCGWITGGRVAGVNLKTLPIVGVLTGMPPAVLVMQWFQQHGWRGANPMIFVVYGMVAGALCGIAVALAIGLLNQRRSATPPYDIVV